MYAFQHVVRLTLTTALDASFDPLLIVGLVFYQG